MPIDTTAKRESQYQNRQKQHPAPMRGETQIMRQSYDRQNDKHMAEIDLIAGCPQRRNQSVRF